MVLILFIFIVILIIVFSICVYLIKVNDTLERGRNQKLEILETLSEGVLIYDKEGNVIYKNSIFIKMFEVDEDEIEGVKIDGLVLDVIEDEDVRREYENKIFTKVFDNKENLKKQVVQIKTKRKNKTKYLKAGIFPIIDKGRVDQAYVTFLEITDSFNNERELETLRNKYTYLFNRMTVGFALCDILYDEEKKPVDYRYLAVNPTLEKIIGAEAENIVGRTVNEIFSNIDEEWLDVFEKMVTTDKQISHRLYSPILHKNFELFGFIPGKGQVGIFVKDITDVKNLEDEREKLVMRIKHANDELIMAKDAAEEAGIAKNSFLANMSHEIRTPLNGILGMGQVMEMTDLTKEQEEYLGIILNSGDLLLGVINNILDISKIESGKVALESKSFMLSEIIEQVIMSYSIIAHKKNIDLIYFIEPDVSNFLIGDEGRIKQVIVNLLSNAVKFTEHGEVLVYVKKVVEENGRTILNFSVKDTGIGISKKNQAQLFEKFYQGESGAGRAHGGTGLGLAIVKEIVLLMGGNIFVESEEGKGSRFYFDAVFYIDADRNKMRKIENKSGISGSKMLVIDNDKESLEKIKQHILKYDLDFVVSESEKEALEILEKDNSFTAILLNMQTGLEELKEFISLKDRLLYGKRIKLIILINEEIKELFVNAEYEKVVEMVIVPIENCELYMSLRRALHREVGIDKKQIKSQTREKKILVVEDNFVNRKTTVVMLDKLGYKTMVAEDGIDALKVISNNEFDLILMDVEMPKMDGIETARKIREIEKMKKTPIIALTAYAFKGDREKCFEAGMDAYLSKPYKIDDLNSLIEKYIKG